MSAATLPAYMRLIGGRIVLIQSAERDGGLFGNLRANVGVAQDAIRGHSGARYSKIVITNGVVVSQEMDTHPQERGRMSNAELSSFIAQHAGEIEELAVSLL